MKKSLSKIIVAMALALGLFNVCSTANAYNYQGCAWVPGYYGAHGAWHPGHRVCRSNYGRSYGGYSVDRCGWIPGHYASYGFVPGHRACWW